MTPERYQQLMEIIDQLLDRPAAERSAILDHFCNGDDSLRCDVEQLIGQQSSITGFLEHSPLEALTHAEVAAIIGRRVGPYRLTESIGRGGMGAVYKAVRDDQEYRTEVAIKLIKRGMDTDYILRRFRNERQILANLNHPNIARLLDGGTTEEGLPYFVMEYIDGEPIDDYCAERNLSIAERLKLFRTACSAVQYAHQNLVIHRDLKPSNILVTKDGIPKLLDFGIAKLLQANDDASVTVLTATELRVMTPQYASPEQITGGPITTATDLYSLGVVLYELLTGRRPYRFKSKNQDDVARVICEQEPAKPSKALNGHPTVVSGKSGAPALVGASPYPTPHAGDADATRPLTRAVPTGADLRGDLDAIVLMALRKEPDRRYSSVQEFSEDIYRHLEGLPVRARQATLGYRGTAFLRRHVARNWKTVALILFICALVGGSAAALSVYWVRSTETSASVTANFNSIAVLPFKYVGEGNPYLGLGLAENLIARLGRANRFDVRPLRAVHSYATSEAQNARLIGQTLGVEAVLDGRIAHNGDQLIVSAELLDVRDGRVLWRQRFSERSEDVAAIPDKISTHLEQALALPNVPGMRSRRVSAAAYEAFLKGRFLWNKRTPEAYERAIESFNQALALEPDYAEAYAGLADAYALLACTATADLPFAGRPEKMAKAKEAARRALELDESLAEPHATLGFIGWHYEWDWAASDREFRRAIELNPNYATAHHWYAYLLIRLNRMDEAVAEIRRARQLDPLSVIINVDVSEILLHARRYDETIEAGRQALDLAPDNTNAHVFIALAHYFKGEQQEYINQLEQLVKVTDRKSDTLGRLAAAYFHLGRRREAETIRSELRRRGERIELDRGRSREMEEHYEFLELEYKYRGAGITAIHIDPRWDSLRADPRIQEYIRRTGLAQYQYAPK